MSFSLPSLSDPSFKTNSVKSSIELTCTPCQHVSARTAFDKWHTLWSSWAVEEVKESISGRAPKKVYFAGDTGYRTVRHGEKVEDQPVCPAFAEIGETIGPFDLAMIPIGWVPFKVFRIGSICSCSITISAYSPRTMWSNLHAHPEDSVRIYKDIRAKKGLGMHWGYVDICLTTNT